MHKRKSGAKRFLVWFIIWLVTMGTAFGGGWYMGVESMKSFPSVLLVNDANRLSADYAPADLVNLYEQRHSFRLASSDIYMSREAYTAMEKMFSAAEADGVNGFVITSGYRSYDRQIEIFAETEAGKAQQPGASEHQTGLAFDVTAENNGGFETTVQYSWLCDNAYKYGFIQRYPAGKESITGIAYEPWHYRYVGVEVATFIHEKGITLEEFCEDYQ